jgi:hypothetical protein
MSTYLKTFPNKITMHLWKEKFAFPLKDYPKNPDGTLNDKYKITKIVRNELG